MRPVHPYFTNSSCLTGLPGASQNPPGCRIRVIAPSRYPELNMSENKVMAERLKTADFKEHRSQAANTGPGDADDVLVVVNGENARAYPIARMSELGVVNDSQGGETFAVTYCDECLTGLRFNARLGDEDLLFTMGEVRGDVKTLLDQKGGLWGQLSGMALDGVRSGESLRIMAMEQLKFKEFKERYPAGLVLII